MDKKRTPDTVPSVASTTFYSSADKDDVVRVLFQRPEQDTPVKQNSRRWPVTEYANVESPASGASDATVAKAPDTTDGTKKPLFDLGAHFYQAIRAVDEAAASNIQPKGNETKTTDETNQTSAQRDTPIERSCHGGLNLSPKQLADIFSLFDSTEEKIPQKSPPRQQEPQPLLDPLPIERSPTSVSDQISDDAATEVTSNTASSVTQRLPQMESLKRECEALKQIIRVDSVNMFKLKSDLESSKTETAKNIAEIKVLQNQLDVIRRERDLQKERESQHRESIKALKSELDELTKGGSDIVRRQELELIRMENELFATQIIENEKDLRVAQERLQLAEAQNIQLQKEVESGAKDHHPGSETGTGQNEEEAELKAQTTKRREQATQETEMPPVDACEQEGTEITDVLETPSTNSNLAPVLDSTDADTIVEEVSSSQEALALKVLALEARLTHVEAARQSFEEGERRLEEEMQSIKAILQSKEGCATDKETKKERSLGVNVTEESGDVEITLQVSAKEQHQELEQPNDQTKEEQQPGEKTTDKPRQESKKESGACDSWNDFCGCFPSSGVPEEP